MVAARLLRPVILLLCVFSPQSIAGDAQTAYWLHCAGCHRLDGSGVPPEVPTLIDEPGRIAGLPGGREYLMRIPGVALAGLDDERLAGVLNFMLETFSKDSLPLDFEPFRAEEVGRLRRLVLKDPLRSRQEIVAVANHWDNE